jgi:hypothetical protein
VALWDVVFEHPLYFTERSLRRLAAAVGLDVADSGSGFGGQYLWIETGPVRRSDGRPSTTRSAVRAAHRFEHLARAAIDHYAELLDRSETCGRRVALWGTGSKGTTFVNSVPGAGSIPVVVDVNPRKHGLHLPGTGQVVSAPADLPAYEVDEVIVLNPNYRSEVGRTLRELGVSATVLDPLPVSAGRA